MLKLVHLVHPQIYGIITQERPVTLAMLLQGEVVVPKPGGRHLPKVWRVTAT